MNAVNRRTLLSSIFICLLVTGVAILSRPATAISDDSIVIAANHPDSALNSDWQRAKPDTVLRMSAVLALRNQSEMLELKAQLEQPGSPNYHKWLSTAEFMRRFGPTQAQLDQLVRWLRANHFTIEQANLGTRIVRFTASVTNVERAFSTEIVTNAGLHANASDLRMPAAPGTSVLAIFGFNRNQAHPHNAQLAKGNAASKNHLSPQGLWTFYDESPPTTPGNNGGTGDTGGDCIALLETQTVDPRAVKKFTKRFKLPPVTLTVLPTDPGNPLPMATANEPYLDIEWSHSVSPNTPVALYVANDPHSSQTQLDALSLAVFQNACGVISSSIHDAGKACPGREEIPAYNNAYTQAVMQGITVFHAVGDFGSWFDCGQPGDKNGATKVQPSIDESAASEDVTLVGGTQFDAVFNAKGVNTLTLAPGVEHVWNSWEHPVMPVPPPDAKIGREASSGGISVVIPKPAFQDSIKPFGVKPSDFAMRGVPDVSAVASGDKPGLWIATTKDAAAECGKRKFCFVSSGGTSVASPIWAGISRLLAQNRGTTRLGKINPQIYALAAAGSGALVDVSTKGENCPFSDCDAFPGYRTGIGYDLSTGLGSPDINLLISEFGSAP